MAPVLEISCLGRLSLHCRGGPELPSRTLLLPATLKAQSLLAYLITHRDGPHTRDQLAELFWGDRPEHNARRSLTTALWQIRRCLPSVEFLLASAAGVQFNPKSAFWLDVTVFERLVHTFSHRSHPSSAHISALEQAVEVYRGDFLDGFYDDWVLTERYRLESLYHDALAQLTVARESSGEHDAALATALRLLERDPLREDAHRAAMRAYCRLGQRHAALEHYMRCEQLLAQELGVGPADETVALRREIANGQLAPVPAAALRTLPNLVPARRELARHPLDAAGQVPLVGRGEELAFLAEGWQAALTGGCSLFLVSGEAGVGKTRLVQEFSAQLSWQGAGVLQGRCYEFERLLPYQPVVEAFRALVPGLAAGAAASLPAWMSVQVARLAPDIIPPVTKPALGAGQGAPGEVESQERLFEALAVFLSQLAGQQPLLLVLEDLHWATDSTLQLLHYLARALARHPVLIVGTLRIETTPAAHPLSTLGRRLERDGLARRLKLSRLSSQAVAALVERMSGVGEEVASLAHRLYLETEGNPFYLIQIIKALFEQGALRIENDAWQGDFEALGREQLPLPLGVSETITASVGRLSEATQDALRVAAVLGREFDFDLLNRVWRKGEELTLAALDELLRCRLIAEAAGGYGAARADYAFTHHKIQEVVFGTIPRHRRLYLHGLVGREMERWLGPETATRAAELAKHFENARQLDAGLTDKAIAYLLQAGRQAERQSANQEAITYYRRGLDILASLPGSPQRLQQELDLQLALAVPTTVVHGYASPATRHVYEQGVALSRRIGMSVALFNFLAGLTRHHGVAGDHRVALETAKELLAIAEAAQDADMLMEAYRQSGGASFALGRLREARAFFEAGLALYEPTQHERLAYRFGHDPAVTYHGLLGLALWLLGYPQQSVGQSQRLRGLLRSLSHPTSLTCAHCLLAKHACVRCDSEAARHHAEEAIRLGQAHRLPSWMAMGDVLRGWALVEQGQATGGLAQLKEGIVAWRAIGFVHFVPFFLALHAEACLKTHQLNEMLGALSTARAIAQSGEDRYWLAEVDRLHGELWLASGDDSVAEAYFRSALATAHQQGARMLGLRAAMSLARQQRSLGKVATARETLLAVYAGFTEGFATPDLKSAAALLESLTA